MKMKSWSITDVGRKRDHNEDSMFADDDLGLWIVADGMGGHEAGETASRIAVETLEHEVVERAPLLFESSPGGGTRLMTAATNDPVVSMLTESVQAASGAILDKAREDSTFSGMGTTLVSVYAHDDQVYFAHVGDSRLYRIRNGKIEQLSTDHSLVQEQLAAGIISRKEAETSPYKNIITRSVGFERKIDVDCEAIDMREGDLLLLCSDGLSNMVTDKEILEILSHKEPPVALEFFINLANSRGGDDNITAVVVEACAD
jgi:protein phosphatase